MLTISRIHKRGRWACVAAALVSGCSGTSVVSAPLEPSATEVSISLLSPTSELGGSENSEQRDITLSTPIDEAEALAISGAYSDDVIFGPTLPAGDWFSDSFSQAIAFRLPVQARLVGQGRGWITLDLEPSDRGAGGRVRIVEVVAMSSPNGPIPIGNIDSGTEFSDTTVSASGTATADGRLLSWRDLQIESSLVPEMFHEACHTSQVGCVPALISEGGPVHLELDLDHRTVSQEFGDHKLIVVATAESLATTPLPAIALEISASIITTERTEDAARRPLASLGLRVDAMPVGRWFVEIDGVVVDLSLDSAVEDMGVFAIEESWFAVTPRSGDFHGAVSVQVFQGFPEGVVLTEDIEDGPLSAEAFLAGMSQVVDLDIHGPSTIGRLDSVRFGMAISDDLPYGCSALERRDLEDDQRCVKWSVNGWHTHDPTGEGTDGQAVDLHYVEDLGVIVEYPVFDNDSDRVLSESVQHILDGLQFSAP